MAFIVHDLRTPLSAIAISANVLELTLPEQAKDADTNQIINTLQRYIRHLRELIGKVLKENTSDSPDSAAKPVCRTIDLWPLVEAVKEDLKPIAAMASTEIVNAVPGDLTVYADAGLLTRVFQNLISNALTYTPRGKLIIEAHQCDQDGTVECFVSDNGSGIPPAMLTKVFDKYETDSQERRQSRTWVGHRQGICRSVWRQGLRRERRGRRLEDSLHAARATVGRLSDRSLELPTSPTSTSPSPGLHCVLTNAVGGATRLCSEKSLRLAQRVGKVY